MANINTLIEEAQLMKQNRADLVAQLNELGFTSVNETTPLSSIAKYMQWAGGLLDVRLATFSKTTKAQRFWTYDEWMAQSAQSRASYIMMGVVLRAEGQEFIIAKENVKSDTNGDTMSWAANTSNDVKGLTNFSGNPAVQWDFDGHSNTNLILAAIDANGIDYQAARRARAYRCCSFADGGVEDPTEWDLPAIGQLWFMYKYWVAINDAFKLFGMPTMVSDWYWSSTEYSSSHAWSVNMTNGYFGNYYKTTASRVRPVAAVAESCRSVGAI